MKCSTCGKSITCGAKSSDGLICSTCFRKTHWLYGPLKRALKSGKIYGTVHSVSRSGMSRQISLYIVYKGEIFPLNWHFGDIYGKLLKNGNVRINGCGMDMLFAATNSLWRFVLPKTKPYARYIGI